MLLHKELESKGINLILASQSPRRRALMTECGFTPELVSIDVDESYPLNLPADEVASYLSNLKSEAYPKELSQNEILITADTIVIIDGEVLGKPNDRGDAIEMLNRLAGSQHSVITGVTLRSAERKETFSSITKVYFAELSREQIEYYVDTYSPYDKAGSYGIQEWIGYVAIERIDGSFYNVMGLPIQRLYSELSKLLTR
ncbi:MAG: Maf family protein [Rikenellaceae bacterium]